MAISYRNNVRFESRNTLSGSIELISQSRARYCYYLCRHSTRRDPIPESHGLHDSHQVFKLANNWEIVNIFVIRVVDVHGKATTGQILLGPMKTGWNVFATEVVRFNNPHDASRTLRKRSLLSFAVSLATLETHEVSHTTPINNRKLSVVASDVRTVALKVSSIIMTTRY